MHFLKLPNEIHRLVHDAFVDYKLTHKRHNNILDLYPHLNKIKETKIIIAELDGKIIGTNSVTADGIHGLHTDYYFKEETDKIRKEVQSNLGCSWRIATLKEYKKNIGLLLDIIKKTGEVIADMGIETCLYAFNIKHEKFYKKLLSADTIAIKDIVQEEGLNTQLVLMKTDTLKTFNHINNVFFKKRKF